MPPRLAEHVRHDEDVRQPNERQVRVCTGTACFATTAGAHVAALEDGLRCRLGERAHDGSVSLTETACLGLCHSSPAIRDGDVVDAGPGVVDRVVAAAARAGREPVPRAAAKEPVLLAYGHDWAGLSKAMATMAPEDLLAEVQAADVRDRGGSGVPAGAALAAANGARKLVVAAGGDDASGYVDKVLMEQHPELVLEGLALAGYAIGAEHGFVVTPAGYPRARPRLDAVAAMARSAGVLGRWVFGSDFAFDVTVAREAPGTASAATVVVDVETLCNIPVVVRIGARAYRRLSGGGTPGTKLVCFNERFVAPGVYEVPFGMTLRELCFDLAGGLRDGHALKALQIGGSTGAILPASMLDTRFDFDDLAAVGCSLGHGSLVGFDETTDMRALATHLLRFGGSPIGGSRHANGTFDRTLLEPLGDMPASIRSLLAHFPDELAHA